MSTESKGSGRAVWLLPLLLALPFAAAIVFAAIRFGPEIMKLLNAAIKTAVVS